MRTRKRLAGKGALVTGGGSGIGRATAIRFAEEGAGVVVTDIMADGGRETVAHIEANGGAAIFVQADVAVEQDCAHAVQEAIREFSELSVLFACAGVMTNADVIHETLEQWNRLLAVNLSGIFLMSKYAVPEMIKGGGGAIVCMASLAGLMGVPALAAYSTAKAGVLGLTRQMASDYAPYQIRVNSISPGTVDTPMLERFLQQVPDPEAARQSFIALHPLGRLCDPRDIAHAALFLASDEAAFITGQNLIIDGGYQIRTTQPRE